MIFAKPVIPTIHGPGWVRPAGNTDFRLTQDFGPSSIGAEPRVTWPGGDGLGAATYVDFHQGIDLGDGRCGAPVLAAGSGIVDFAGLDATGNRVVIINHGNRFRSWYGHLGDKTVSKGQHVSTGQIIGHVGSTAASACHLHFGVEWLDLPGTVTATGNGGTWHNKFVDPWRRLDMNVKLRPRGEGVNLRTGASTGSPVYAVTKPDGRIHRVSDGSDRGATETMRPWGGVVAGGGYSVGGVDSSSWDKMWLDGAYRYIGTLLVVRSIS